MASTPILPFAVWAAGTNQNSIPANDNSRRNQILNGMVISKAVTAQPASPADGDIYILAATHTGAQWAAFDPDDLVIFVGGTWYAFAPVDGVVVNFEGTQEQFTGSSGWDAVGGGGGSTAWVDLTGVPANLTQLGALTDPGADRLLFWDDSAGAYTHLTLGTNLSITGTTMDAAGGGGGSVAGSDKQIQYNNAGAFGAEAGFEYDQSTNTMTVANVTYSGLALTAASATGGAGLRLPHGAAPTSPTNGDVWTTTAGMYVRVNGATVGPLAAGGGGGVTGWTSALTTASPNGTNNVASFTADTVSTNGDAALAAKGNGATLAQIPDSSTTGGDKRGDRATDWQKSRSGSAMVASGSYATISGGQNNTAAGGGAAVTGGTGNSASGSNATAGGNANVASGITSIALGSGNTASVQGAVGIGSSHEANGTNCIVLGKEGSARGVDTAMVFSSGRLFNPYDTQLRSFILKASTSNATVTNLTTDGGGTGTVTNQISMLNGTQSLLLKGYFQARDTGNNDSWFAEFTVSVKVVSGTGTVQGTPTVTNQFQDSGASTWALAFTPSTSPRVLQLRVTGQAAKDIRWNCFVQVLEISNS